MLVTMHAANCSFLWLYINRNDKNPLFYCYLLRGTQGQNKSVYIERCTQAWKKSTRYARGEGGFTFIYVYWMCLEIEPCVMWLCPYVIGYTLLQHANNVHKCTRPNHLFPCKMLYSIITDRTLTADLRVFCRRTHQPVSLDHCLPFTDNIYN